MEKKLYSAEETRAFGRSLALALKPGVLVVLRGELGAGKTTLVQGILEGLGAKPPYPSPTFILMHEYRLPCPSVRGIKRVYHADAYRVEAADFERLGFAEWCADSDGLVLLEWPERLATILPEQQIGITLATLSETEQERVVTVKNPL